MVSPTQPNVDKQAAVGPGSLLVCLLRWTNKNLSRTFMMWDVRTTVL